MSDSVSESVSDTHTETEREREKARDREYVFSSSTYRRIAHVLVVLPRLKVGQRRRAPSRVRHDLRRDDDRDTVSVMTWRAERTSKPTTTTTTTSASSSADPSPSPSATTGNSGREAISVQRDRTAPHTRGVRNVYCLLITVSEYHHAPWNTHPRHTLNPLYTSPLSHSCRNTHHTLSMNDRSNVL